MQLSPIHTVSGGVQSVLKFQLRDRWNSIGLVPEKSAILKRVPSVQTQHKESTETRVSRR